MVIPHWIRFARGAITGCLALSYRAKVGVYYSIVSKVCQPFFGVFDLLYYTAYDHHYSVWFVTVSHYNTTSITTAWVTVNTACHYSVFTTVVAHYSVSVFTTAYAYAIWFLCVFSGLSRGPTFVFASFPSIFIIIFSLYKNCKEEVALLRSFGVSVWFYWLFWWGVLCQVVSLGIVLLTSWFCWIFLDPEPSGIGSVLNSGIWPSCLTFPAFWTNPVSLIVLIVYDLLSKKSTPNVNFFWLFLPCG